MVDLTTFSNNVDSTRFEQTMQSTRTAGVKPLYISDRGIPKRIIRELIRPESLLSEGRNIEGSFFFTEDGAVPAYTFIGDWISNSSQVLVYFAPRFEPDLNPFVWTPQELFGAGDDGIWADFSDTSVMWQELEKVNNVSDGQQVSVVEDKSGNGNDLTVAASLNQPVYDQASNSLSLNATDSLQAGGPVFGTMHNSPFTVAVLFAPGNVPDPNDLYLVLSTNTSLSSSDTGYYLAYDDRNTVPRNNAILTQVAKGVLGSQTFLFEYNNQAPAQAFTSYIQTYDAGAPPADPDFNNVYVDNTELTSTFAVQNGGSAASTSRPLTLGDVAGGGSPSGNAFVGKISEVVVVNRIITDTERQELHNYFQNKVA